MKLIECPRDAMQGVQRFIPSNVKTEYLNLLLKVGFDTLDFGSFVSPKAIPQMADTRHVLEGLRLNNKTKLLAIVANSRGIDEANNYEQITYLGFPFSISPTFQQRNTKASIEEALKTVERLLNQCSKRQKEAIVYLSMAFGNPYGDAWNLETIYTSVKQLADRGVSILAISDTIGAASPQDVSEVYRMINSSFPDIEVGLHLHSRSENTQQMIEAAFSSGCRRLDSALRGYGGCPMAQDELTGNIPTELLIKYLKNAGEEVKIDEACLVEALSYSDRVFGFS